MTLQIVGGIKFGISSDFLVDFLLTLADVE